MERRDQDKLKGCRGNDRGEDEEVGEEKMKKGNIRAWAGATGGNEQ